LYERYLTLLSTSGAADLLDSNPDEMKTDGAFRIALAASVEVVDTAYEALRAVPQAPN